MLQAISAFYLQKHPHTMAVSTKESESKYHDLLRFHCFSEERKKILDNLQNIDSELLRQDENNLVHILLYISSMYKF